MKFGKP